VSGAQINPTIERLRAAAKLIESLADLAATESGEGVDDLLAADLAPFDAALAAALLKIPTEYTDLLVDS
jgi:uncharacterized protein (DUF2345 family)